MPERRKRSRSTSNGRKRVKREKDSHRIRVKSEKDPLPDHRGGKSRRRRDETHSSRSRHRVKKEKKVKREKTDNRVHPDQQRNADRAFHRGEHADQSSGGESDSEVEQPNFVPSGVLKKGTKLQKNGKDLKYLPPSEAHMPDQKWRFHVFKEGEQKRVLHLHRRDHFLFGRDRKVCEIDLHHISVSSQHAVLQYRLRKRINALGEPYSLIVPYLMDLDSKHGTKINGEKMVPRKYYELLSKDVISFGLSTRNYVWLKQDEVQIDYDEAVVVNHTEKTKVKLAEVESAQKAFVEVGEKKPKALKELNDEDLWDL